MKNIFILHIILLVSLTFSFCNGEVRNETKNFPGAGAPAGNDVISSSTNMSGKENETEPKLSAYAGAAFVQAPQINNYGSVSLAYEIVVPPGRAGMQPGLGLSYSSSGGDGLAWHQDYPMAIDPSLTRQELYELRDSSGLSRADFFWSNFSDSGLDVLEVGDDGA